MGERRDLNPRMMESQSTALPLGYARHQKIGKGGIRTPGDHTATLVFKTRAFDHSATFPLFIYFSILKKKNNFSRRYFLEKLFELTS